MSTLADEIEQHLKRMLTHAVKGIIEVRRCDLADSFSCVPSQINYVLQTRFTPERGYFVESRRGGGGYIRIGRAFHGTQLGPSLYRKVGRHLTESEANNMMLRLQEAGLVSEKEALMVRGILRKETSWVDPPMKDIVRATIVKTMLVLITQEP